MYVEAAARRDDSSRRAGHRRDRRSAAGHDGRAELVVELAYPNGARTHLSVTEEAMARALDAAGARIVSKTSQGQPWTVLIGPERDLT